MASKKRRTDSTDDSKRVKRHKISNAGASGSKSTDETSNAPVNVQTPSAVVLSSSAPNNEDTIGRKGKQKAIGDGTPVMSNNETDNQGTSKNPKPRPKINKLVPPRPFPTVPTSVSAAGPRSAHKEGKNMICISRKTPLGAYLRRCKDVVLKDGYKTLHLSAMGAAIPHLLQLSVSLPSILPFAPDEIHTEILTGTVEVQDEIIPDDEDEDISYKTRGKSTLSVVIKIGDGVNVGSRPSGTAKAKGKRGGGGGTSKATDNATRDKPEQVVFQEPEQGEMDVA